MKDEAVADFEPDDDAHFEHETCDKKEVGYELDLPFGTKAKDDMILRLASSANE